MNEMNKTQKFTNKNTHTLLTELIKLQICTSNCNQE
jgi:hypothetical protein